MGIRTFNQSQFPQQQQQLGAFSHHLQSPSMRSFQGQQPTDSLIIQNPYQPQQSINPQFISQNQIYQQNRLISPPKFLGDPMQVVEQQPINLYDVIPVLKTSKLVDDPSQKDNFLQRFEKYFCVLPLLFCIIFLIISTLLIHSKVLQDKDLQESLLVLKFVQQNLELDPIQNVQLAINDQCPQGYQPLTLGTWLGVNQGCACNSQIHEEFYCETQGTSTCQQINKINPVKITTWRDKKICVQPITTYGYGVCRNLVQKQCSVDLCIDQEEECPINYFEINQGVLQSNLLNNLQLTSLQSIEFSYHSNTIQASQIVQFRFSEGDTLCYNQMRANPTSTQRYYPLLVQDENGCGKYGAMTPYTHAIDEWQSDEMLQQNNILTHLQALPLYQQYNSGDSSINLLIVHRIQVRSQYGCWQYLQTGDFTNIIEEALSLQSLSVFFSIIILATSALVILVCFCFFARIVMQRDRVISEHNVINSMQLHKITVVLIGLIYLFAVIYYIKSEIWDDGVGDITKRFQYLVSNNCFGDRPINDAIIDSLSYIHNSTSMISNLVIELFAAACLYLAIVVLLYCYSKKSRERETNNQN